jgi:uncharacterized protein YidB (DUF937 family)
MVHLLCRRIEEPPDANELVALGRCSTQHTGLSREEILSRLSRDLPDAVDKYTPQGRLPA